MAVARVIVSVALLATLNACASTKEVQELRDQVSTHHAELVRLQERDKTLASSLADVRGRVLELSKIVQGTSALSVQVASEELVTIFSNSTGVSRIVRMTVRNAPPSGSLKTRTVPIGLVEDLGSVGSAGEVYPELDLSAVGAQRIIRLACGLEIQGRSVSGGSFTIAVLVQPDPEPISCDQAKR